MLRSLVFIAVLPLVLTSCATEDVAAPDPTPTQTVEQTPAPLPGGELTSCTNDEGFEISYPTEWETNDGSVVSACSQFHPEPFEVPEGTDERVAAITAYIDPVPFHVAAAPDENRDAERAVTVIDDLQAVRLTYESPDGGFYPEGTPISTYMIDLSPGTDDDGQTLFVDTLGLSGFDYDRNRVILDRMARTIDVTLEGSEADPVIARYEGGGGGFTVTGEVSGDEACLRIPPEGDDVCAETPDRDDVRTIQLVDLQDELFSGVTGQDVFRVTVERRDGETSTFLPAPMEGSELRGFAFTFGLDETERFTWYDVAGERLGSVSPG